MNKVRNVAIGVVVAGLVGAVVVSCGGGGGGGDTPAAPPTPPGPAPTFSVSGTVSGATAPLVLKLNGGSDISQTNGAFSFTGIADLTVFNVQVVSAADRCVVASNGAGKINAADIANVSVVCAAPAAQQVVRSARLSGAQENPPVTSTGSGVGGVVFNPATNGITGGVTLSGITPSGSGVTVSQAPGGNPTGNGASIITLGTAADGKTFFIPVGTLLTGGQAAALAAGELYFQVATAGNATGEIRGQINLQSGVLAGVADITFAQEQTGGTDAGCTGKTTTGQGTVIIDRATLLISTAYMTHNVTNADLAHIHTSLGPATAGAVRINFTPPGPVLAYPTAPASPIAPQDVTDFLADYLYFNIHSTADGCPSGEIRGNIIHIAN